MKKFLPEKSSPYDGSKWRQWVGCWVQILDGMVNLILKPVGYEVAWHMLFLSETLRLNCKRHHKEIERRKVEFCKRTDV